MLKEGLEPHIDFSIYADSKAFSQKYEDFLRIFYS